MRYVALLRGINVGGNTIMKMEELRKSFEALGFENVKSYINSGNLAFDLSMQKPARSKGESVRSSRVSSPHVSKASAGQFESQLETMIEKAIQKDFGKNIPVMVRGPKDFERILAANPFEGEYGSHKEMHVLFLKEEMPKEKQTQLVEAAPEKERFAVKGREIYCHLPMGVAESLLGKGFIEKKLKVAVTGRNWRTVEKLAEL
ncbi:MAG: DUF1697 domain-containing protein [Pyrinomonadaceae bacterium]